MKDIKLQDLLEAGCHFGHKAEKWHPKAASFIYGEREGIHIIDLVKTREGLEKACEFINNLAREGKIVLYIASKRQAKNDVTDAAKKSGVFYMTARWIGGFLTNWEEVKKNIDKINRMRRERDDGTWKKYPKHEIVKMEKLLHQLEGVYGGVTALDKRPDAIFIIDIRREISAVREALRCHIPIIAVVDTNSNPTGIDYVIPANDDAVGSIKLITNILTDAYMEGKAIAQKQKEKEIAKKAEEAQKTTDFARTAEPVKPITEKQQAKVSQKPEETATKEAQDKPEIKQQTKKEKKKEDKSKDTTKKPAKRSGKKK